MKNLLFVSFLGVVCIVNAEWNLSLDSGWRIVGGANYSAGVKTDLNVRGRNAMAFMPAVPHPAGAGREEAQQAQQALANGQRGEFGNGGFIDPNYSGSGELPEYTWNWSAPSGAYRDGRMEFSSDYVEVSSLAEGSGSRASRDSRDMAGFTIEISRNVGQWGRLGLDAALGVSYYDKNDAFKSSGTVYRRMDTVERGSYTTSVDMDSMSADWAQNSDGTYGAGTFDGPGALLPIGGGALNYGNHVESMSASSSSLYLDSRADYEEVELLFAVKPYYDLTDWFRVVGTLGVAVSRGQLDFTMTAISNGENIYAASEKFHQWDCYGVAGLGGMFHSSHTCLGFDFLAKFLDRDIDVDGRDVNGSVERSNWGFRIYAGLDF